jgi:Xaa-Pro aminopeptidase
VTDIHDVRYLSNFTGSSALVVLTRGEGFFLTDPRYTTQAREEVQGLKVRIFRKRGLGEAAALVRKLGVKSLGFESASLSYDAYTLVKKAVAPVRLRPAPGIVAGARLCKDFCEIERIRSSIKVMERGFKAVERFLRPGVTEREAALRAETSFKRNGADGTAFETIIASGERGALPHGLASDKRIKKGELVVVDMGVVKDGYNSDSTRTYCVGRATPRQREVHGTVLCAGLSAIEKIRAGVKASAVDRAARARIRKAGYGKYFSHATGHGVGLLVHEGPVLSKDSKDVLEEGMVVTVEPGIYIPGWGGVRIEDMVAVRKDGPELLTSTPRELICL